MHSLQHEEEDEEGLHGRVYAAFRDKKGKVSRRERITEQKKKNQMMMTRKGTGRKKKNEAAMGLAR